MIDCITTHLKSTFEEYCHGLGVDFGCGKDKVSPNAIGVDFKNAYNIDTFHENASDFNGPWESYIDEHEYPHLDFIYSSHLLEDYVNPYFILEQWSRILLDGGYLILVLPIEKLYREYSSDKNESINYAHKFQWSGAQDFVESMPLSLSRIYDVIAFDGPILNYSFYVVLQKKQSNTNGLIMLSYNSAHAMRISIPRLKLLKTQNTEFIGIDNASTDDSINVFEDFGIEYIKNESNLGFSKAINQGFQYAIDKKWDWVFVCNPDIGAYLGWDENIFSNVPKDANIIGALMMSLDGIHHAGGQVLGSPLQQHMNGHKFINDTLCVDAEVPYSASRLTHKISYSESGKPERVPWVTFAFVAIRTKLINEIGLLNEDFFLYNSDSEYCLRAWAADKAVYYNPIEFSHFVGGSSPRDGERLLEIVATDAALMREMEPELIRRGEARWLLSPEDLHEIK
ncbi:MAG: Glycosyl transferase family 2 [Firmicutes bacterium ADurb.Bin419]|nr:MAG: Glycosyl transferase family 2 [Firmicutes bacterium ADurb.Bin419]